MKIPNACCIAILFAAILIGSVHAQQPVQTMSQHSYYNVVTTKEDFNSVPLRSKLRHVFLKLSASDPMQSALSGSDFESISRALLNTEHRLRAYEELKYACSYFNSTPADEIDVGILATALQNARDFELEDFGQVLIDSYNFLSLNAKEIIDNEIDALEGTNAITDITINFRLLASQLPDSILNTFQTKCERLDRVYTAQRQRIFSSLSDEGDKNND